MKKFFALILSLVIMGVIFSRIDTAEFKRCVTAADIPLLILAALFFVPQILIPAYRWQQMVSQDAPLSLPESIRMNLAAGSLNLLFPSRAGDLSKAYFLRQETKLSAKRGMNMLIFEKYLDLASLAIVTTVGLALSARWDEGAVLGAVYAAVTLVLFPLLSLFKINRLFAADFFESNPLLAKAKHFLLDTQDYLGRVKGHGRKFIFITALSVLHWLVDLLQILVIFRALHSAVSAFHIFRFVPLAVLAGLFPVTVAGIGTRDAAMIYFFSPYDQPARIIGAGLFISLRYLATGILGLPFLNRYLLKGPLPGKA